MTWRDRLKLWPLTPGPIRLREGPRPRTVGRPPGMWLNLWPGEYVHAHCRRRYTPIP